MHNPLDTRQLSAFCEIANVSSMRKAAKNLNLTTSAVSHSLKRLEDDLGCKLFYRDTRKLSLTYAGQRLLGVADDILGNLTHARQLVNEWSDIAQKTLRIGATAAACQYIIPMAIREFKESFPSMNIQIITGRSYELIEKMQENKVDVAIYPSTHVSSARNVVSIGSDSLQFVVNPMHPWAIKAKANINEIEMQRVILTDCKGYTFDLIDSYFRNYGVSLMPFIEISNEEVIKRLVELDIGIGILPKWNVRKEEQAGTMVSLSIERRQLKRHWVVSHPENRELTFPETLFVGVSKNVAQNLFSDLLH